MPNKLLKGVKSGQAGNELSIEILKTAAQRVEKKGALQLFELDQLLAVLNNKLAPIIMMASGNAEVLFAFMAMKKLLQNMKKREEKAQETEEESYVYTGSF